MHAVIFGGGKIARGFIAHLLHRSGFQISFVELNEALVQSLNERGKYYVNVMGNPSNSEWIEGFSCIALGDTAGIANALADADIAFTSVGGKNLNALAGTIAAAYALVEQAGKAHEFTIVTCENWKDPAAQLKNAVLQALEKDAHRDSFEKLVGVSQAVILRSGVEATEDVLRFDPNAVSVTDFWELPIDKSRMKGALLPVEGVIYKENFANFLQQKIYTFNTTNATIAYMGRLKGLELLADAANDPQIVELVHRVHAQINPAIAKEMDIALEEQKAFSQKAIKKYQDRSVTDFTERHARDPIRKLGPEDRIVGTLRLAQKHGLPYDALATTLAAALYYPATNPEDPSAAQLCEMRRTQGIDAVLAQVCGIAAEEEAAVTVKQQIELLKEEGYFDA